MNKEQSFAAPSDVDFNAKWHKVEQEEFTGFPEKLHLVGAEAGADLEGNSAQIWDICEPQERLLSITGAVCSGVCTWKHNWIGLVQWLNNPLRGSCCRAKRVPGLTFPLISSCRKRGCGASL